MDIVCDMCQLSTKANHTTVDYVTQANKIICKVKQKVVVLKYQKMKKLLKLAGFCDAWYTKYNKLVSL